MRGYPLLALLLGGVAAPLGAAPLMVSPTTMQLEPGRHSGVVTVENAGDAPVDIQFRAYGWSQRDGADLLADTDEVVVSPAIATIPAHGRQLFRVLERVAAPNGPERSYRLRLTELPGPDQGGVAVRVSFLLPMFSGGAGAATAPEWSIADGRLLLANDGPRRVRLDTLALRLADGHQVALPVPRPTYLLINSRRTWPVSATAVGARLVGTTDTGSFDVPPGALAPSR